MDRISPTKEIDKFKKLSSSLKCHAQSGALTMAKDKLLCDKNAGVNLQLDWAELAVLSSRQSLNGTQDFFLSFILLFSLIFF